MSGALHAVHALGFCAESVRYVNFGNEATLPATSAEITCAAAREDLR